MSVNKQQVRATFRAETYKRDGYKCVMCGKPAPKTDPESVLDAHHITPRVECPNGGYVKENGVSLCKDGQQKSCHMKAEEYLKNGTGEAGFSPDELYAKIGSSKVKAFAAAACLR